MKIQNKKISARPSSARWVQRQLADPYVARAQREKWRSRAVFKLEEIDGKFHILKSGQTVADLGAAPGSWSEYVRRKFPKSRVIAIDVLPIKPIDGVEFYQGDIADSKTAEWLADKLANNSAVQCEKNPGCGNTIPVPTGVDVVLSDMAPNTTGHRETDRLRQAALLECAFEFAKNHLKQGGAFVGKSFAGGDSGGLFLELRKWFAVVRHAKPAASRKESVEEFIVATGFAPRGLG